MSPSGDRPSARLAAAIGWLVTLPLAVMAALRLLRLDDRSGVLFAAQVFTPVMYLPAYGAAIAGWLTKRRLLALTAAAVAGFHLSATWADLPRPRTRSRPRVAGQGVPFDVAALNLRATNSTPHELANAVARLDADLLVLVELTPELLATLRRGGALDRFDHEFVEPRAGFSGVGIFSRHPMGERTRLTVGHPTLGAVVNVRGQALRLVAVHTVQPLADLRALRSGLRRLQSIADTSPEPVIFAGDFNATRQHRPFRDLLSSSNLVDSHVAAGRGYARTWPAIGSLPPFALLDHVVVSRGVEVTSVGEVDLPGSDHRGVVAGLRLPHA